jgi:DNA-binding SARP family transcriptional activator
MQELTTLFWPEVPKDRQRARLRTLLWQVRNSLGADAWRVQRRRDLVVFDTTGVDIVGTRSKAAILRDFSARRTRR